MTAQTDNVKKVGTRRKGTKPKSRKPSRRTSTAKNAPAPGAQPQGEANQPQNGPPAPPKLRPLNPSEQIFVHSYAAERNATKAAKAAGFSEKSAGYQGRDMMKRPHIKAAIAAIDRETLARIDSTGEKVLAELALIAYQDMADFVGVNADGDVQVKRFDTLLPGRSRVVKKIKQTKKTRRVPGAEGATIEEITTEFELHDKESALKMLGVRHGVIKEEGDKDSVTDGVTFTDLERVNRLNRLVNLARERMQKKECPSIPQ